MECTALCVARASRGKKNPADLLTLIFCVIVCSSKWSDNDAAKPMDDISVYSEIADVDHYDFVGPVATGCNADSYAVPADATHSCTNPAYQPLFEDEPKDKSGVSESAGSESPHTNDVYIHPSPDTNDTYIQPSPDNNNVYMRPSSDTSEVYIHPV